MGSWEDGWKRLVRKLANTTVPLGQTALSSPSVTSCINAETWYPIAGTFTNETDINNGFVVDSGDFKSLIDSKATFGGSGNFVVDKLCEITIGLFINGVNFEKANTVITFNASARTLPASRTVAFLINNNDVFDLRVKSDTANTNVTISDLNALFIGLKSSPTV